MAICIWIHAIFPSRTVETGKKSGEAPFSGALEFRSATHDLDTARHEFAANGDACAHFGNQFEVK